jgi:predicted nucleic acid-binding protein
MKVLIDTSFIYGLYIQKSPNHDEAQRILDNILDHGQNDVFITTNHVVQESYSVFSNRVHEVSYLEILDEFFYGQNCFFEIIYVSADKSQDQLIEKIMNQYLRTTPKKLLSFVDASLIYVAKMISANSIISFDTHFDKILEYYVPK